MIDYVIYTSLGEITQVGTCQDETYDLLPINPQDFVLKGKAVLGEQWVVNGEVVDLPPKPSNEYIFDYSTGQWVIDTKALETAIILKRDRLLLDSDWTQLPDVPLTPDQKEQWRVYRQELRDITQQPGYPTNVVFPVAPSTELGII
jgi:hypothetical protein